MRNRRLFIKVFILTSLFWLAIDILYVLTVMNNQLNFFDADSFVPLDVNTNTHEKRSDEQRKNSNIQPYFTDVIQGLGEGGEPATLSPRFKEEAEHVFDNHSFNVILSDHISLDRTLKDVRGPKCREKHKKYPTKLPTTSVIICFHNEALSVLLRTVHSVLNRSPPHLLADIIRVDDFSEYENLKKPLEEQVRQFEKVKVIRMPQREGLVRVRLRGAEVSRGEVLTFLDSHCEATEGWLEPLSARIAQDRKNVVCPVIEVINADDFGYQTSDVIYERGGFSWDLFFTWKAIPEEEKKRREDETDFIRSPTMAGGLFAMHKQYFYDLGSYDDQMDIWGGGNLEMSFRKDLQFTQATYRVVADVVRLGMASREMVDKVKWYSTFVFLFGAIVGFADPITDILTLVEFYRADHKTWFGVGLAFVILPCLVYPVAYLLWGGYDKLTEVSRVRRTLHVLVWALNPFSAALARLRCFCFCLKNFETLRTGGNSEFGEDTDDLLIHSEVALFLEAAFESAPQFIIQLYAMSVQQEPVQIIQMISLPVSFFSLAWASTAADELYLVDSSDLKAKHKVLRFITHLFLLSSRLFAVAFFTVSYKWWIISVLMIHSIAIVTTDTILFCRGENCGAVDVGFPALFFCLHWLRDDVSLTRIMEECSLKQLSRIQLFSNVLFIVENIAMILTYYFSEFSNTWYSLPVTICVCLFSVLGSTIRVIHYRFLTKEESNDAVSLLSVNNNNLSTTSEPLTVNLPDQPQVIVINQGSQQEKESESIPYTIPVV